MPRVCLVTGASGFLAAWVVKILQDNGYRVRGTVRSLKNAEKIKHLYNLCENPRHQIELIEADLLEEKGWDKAVEGCTYVHHVASPFPLINPKNEDEVIKPAVDGTLNVLRACSKVGSVKRVVLTSSRFAVANTAGKVYDESDWAKITSKTAPYSKSKAVAERAAWEFVRNLPDESKFELSVVNPDFIVGPSLHGNAGTSTNIVSQLLNNEFYAALPFEVGCIDVRDVALAHLKCMTMPEAAGHRHILCSRTMWMKEMASILDQEFGPQGYTVTNRVAPKWIIWMMSFVSDYYRNLYLYLTDCILSDNSRMKNVLGIEPTPLDKSFIDAGYALIELGVVKKTDKYEGPKNTKL